MARIERLPRSELYGVVDAKALLEGRTVPPVDDATGMPTELLTLVVNQDPRMVLVPNFLSPAECEHLITLAEGQWTRSLVGSLYQDPAEKELAPVGAAIISREAKTRTSSSSLLRPAQTAVVERIEHRLARLARQPIEQLERLVVVRYSPGEEFSEHHDGKFRPVTVFVYLNDLPEGAGGDTFFSHLGLSFVPRAGAAAMWPNATPEGKEDSRMVHAGRPPASGVKYGVNCFFNEERVRLLRQPDGSVLAEDAFLVDVNALSKQRAAKDGGAAQDCWRLFKLDTEPCISAAAGFLSEEEVQHLLELVTSRDDTVNAVPACFAGSTVLLRRLEPGATPLVAQLEERLARLAQREVEHMGPLRIVQCATTLGRANRGCGQRSLLICLSERDEVFFPHLGVRIALQRGDLLDWPNAWETAPVSDEPGAKQRVVEDVRTTRVHLGAGEGPTLALDISFHDIRIRAPRAAEPAAEPAAETEKPRS